MIGDNRHLIGFSRTLSRRADSPLLFLSLVLSARQSLVGLSWGRAMGILSLSLSLSLSHPVQFRRLFAGWIPLHSSLAGLRDAKNECRPAVSPWPVGNSKTSPGQDESRPREIAPCCRPGQRIWFTVNVFAEEGQGELFGLVDSARSPCIIGGYTVDLKKKEIK